MTLLDLLNLIGGVPVADTTAYSRFFTQKIWDFKEVFEVVQNVLHVDGFFRWEIEFASKTTKDNSSSTISRHFIKVGYKIIL